MLQSMGQQRVGHDLVTKQQSSCDTNGALRQTQEALFLSNLIFTLNTTILKFGLISDAIEMEWPGRKMGSEKSPPDLSVYGM